MHLSRTLAASLAVGLLFAVTAAQASLIGDTFDCADSFVGPGSPSEICNGSDILIGPGIEKSTFAFQVDVDASSITITNTTSNTTITFSSVSTNTIEFTSLDWFDFPNGIITDFALTTDVTGLLVSDVTIQDHGVTLIVDEPWGPGEFAMIDLITDHAAVPEPSSLLLLGSGLFGLAGWRWRQRTATS